MRADTALNLIKRLQDEYKKQYPPAGSAAAVKTMMLEPEEAADFAFDRIVMESNMLPTANKVLSIVQSEGKRIRAEQAEAERRQALSRDRSDVPNYAQATGGTAYGVAAKNLILRLLTGAVDYERYLLECGQLAMKYDREDQLQWAQEEWQDINGRVCDARINTV